MIGVDTTILVHLEIRESPDHDRATAMLRREVLDAGDETTVKKKSASLNFHRKKRDMAV